MNTDVIVIIIPNTHNRMGTGPEQFQERNSQISLGKRVAWHGRAAQIAALVVYLEMP